MMMNRTTILLFELAGATVLKKPLEKLNLKGRIKAKAEKAKKELEEKKETMNRLEETMRKQKERAENLRKYVDQQVREIELDSDRNKDLNKELSDFYESGIF